MKIIYQHPDGGRIELDTSAARIVVTTENGHSASLPIGPAGAMGVGITLEQIGRRWLEFVGGARNDE